MIDVLYSAVFISSASEKGSLVRVAQPASVAGLRPPLSLCSLVLGALGRVGSLGFAEQFVLQTLARVGLGLTLPREVRTLNFTLTGHLVPWEL